MVRCVGEVVLLGDGLVSMAPLPSGSVVSDHAAQQVCGAVVARRESGDDEGVQ